MAFAQEIVARFHDEAQAQAAYAAFVARFQQKEIPEDIEIQNFTYEDLKISQWLKKANLTQSTSEA